MSKTYLYIFCCPTNGSLHTKIWKWEYTVLAAPKEARTPAREKERLLAKNKSTLISRFISRCWNNSNPRKPMPSEWEQIIEEKKMFHLFRSLIWIQFGMKNLKPFRIINLNRTFFNMKRPTLCMKSILRSSIFIVRAGV